MGRKIVALKRTGTDRVMTGIDMISFIQIFKRACMVSVFTFYTLNVPTKS